MYVPHKNDFDTKKSADRKASDSAELSLQLKISSFEKEILLKACKSYRVKIPSYIQSKLSELHAIDRVIKKLT